MEAVSAVNATQDEFQLLPLPDDDPGNRGYPDYDPNVGANAPASPTLMFEGVFPEDPIKQLSVQVEVSYCSNDTSISANIKQSQQTQKHTPRLAYP